MSQIEETAGVSPQRRNFLPYALPSVGDEEIKEVADTLRSGWLTTGPKVKVFEERFASYVEASHAVAVNSCTAGLQIALAALDIGPGDEVIVPTMTFCSTANVVVHRGARPVLVDVGPDCNVIPQAVEAAITSATRAIIPVHYGGQACDLDDIYRIAVAHGLAVVEDAAHAAGSTYRGHKVGSDALGRGMGIPHATVFSFYATKNMTTGEGGMITTSDEEMARRMRRWAQHGMDHDAWTRSGSGGWYYEVVDAGYKANMTDLQAALGIHQLARLDGFIAARQRLARLYDQLLEPLHQHLRVPLNQHDRTHAYHLYAVHLQSNQGPMNRSAFIERMKQAGVGTSVHFIPVHMQPYYQRAFGYGPNALPHAEALYEGIVSLPLYPRMTEDDVRFVADTVATILLEGDA